MWSPHCIFYKWAEPNLAAMQQGVTEVLYTECYSLHPWGRSSSPLRSIIQSQTFATTFLHCIEKKISHHFVMPDYNQQVAKKEQIEGCG